MALKLVMIGGEDSVEVSYGMREWIVGSTLNKFASIHAARTPFDEQIRTDTALAFPCERMETKRVAFAFES